MADEIKLKIVLEDGTVKEGFLSVEKQAKQTSDNIKKNFDKSGGAFGKIADGADNLTGSLQQATSSAGGLLNVISNIGPYGKAAAAAAVLVGTVGKLALVGEQVNAINAQFENIASANALAVDNFRQSILDATKGLIDDEDALQIATKGIIALGTEASKIPEILNASRSVSKALGKDFKDTFADLSQFVEAGNARVLRQYGIILDLDKAYKDAAESIGITAAQLSEQQKQIIRSNLILDEVPKKFSAAAESVTPFKDAIDRLKVSVGNTFEDIASRFAELSTRAFLDKDDLSNVSLPRIRDRAKETAEEMEKLEKSIKKSAEIGNTFRVEKLTKELEKLREQANLFNVERSGREERDLFAQLEASKTVKTTVKLELTPEQRKAIYEQRKKQEAELTQFLAAEEQKRIQSVIQFNELKLQQEQVAAQKIQLIEENQKLKLSALDSAYEAQVKQTKQKFAQDKLAGTIAEQTALNALEATYSQQRILIQEQEVLRLKELREQQTVNEMGAMDLLNFSFSSTLDELSNKFKSFALTAGAAFQEVRKQAVDGLAKGTTQAFANFGQALGRGQDASKAFADSVAQSIANAAASFGNFFIQTGLGRIALSFGSDPTGYAMLAAGIALNALAGSLAPSTQTETSTGGGIAASPSTQTELTQTEQLERQEVGTQVQVVIQGDVLDSDESGSRIIGLINQAFDKKGVIINQGVMA